ncbi:hypothetical protein MU516_16770 [Paracoccus sp. YLB-12]|uniref:Uncharacterized protein n=1 Tax=Paracoccus maritimus TaxID=2933292 RepID=A0ABT2KD81_9RHOB|nr:hypothetical protein [Paracoccus sp. YLB-12]MCT4334510.1 hypothetical protein [Paracoccus sp. YLB-12]
MSEMWSMNDPALCDMENMQIRATEVLEKYDDPILFTAKVGFEDYIFLNVMDLEDGFLFAASSITEEAISLLKNNKLSILGALRSGDFIVVECASDYVVRRYWPIDIDRFDQSFLPDPGAALSLEVDGVADTVDQAKSYFSIRLSGGTLNHERMAFHQFKKMVDNAYVVARKLLAPAEVKSSKSQVYDFQITEPEFGSLIINIERPKLPRQEIVSNYFMGDAVSQDDLRNIFWETKGKTLNNLRELKNALDLGKLDDATVSNFALLIRDISSIFPDRRDAFSDIEFSGEVDGAWRTLKFDGDDTAELKEAHRRFFEKPQFVTGVISIINEGTLNVVIKVLGTNEVRCNFSAEDFAEMKAMDHFQTGNMLRAHGTIFSRSRRDIMNCDSAADIFTKTESPN